jgi:uncharacterized protein YndB with AHSA1/START domain
MDDRPRHRVECREQAGVSMKDYGITGMRVELEITLDVPAERLWELITDVPRISEWSPECEHAAWLGDDPVPAPGTRFTGRNRREDRVWTVTCEITEAERPHTFAWVVLDRDDDPQRPSSWWRYELEPGDSPEETVVRQSFAHGPGQSGLREIVGENPEMAELIIDVRKAELREHMADTLTAMAASADSWPNEPLRV